MIVYSAVTYLSSSKYRGISKECDRAQDLIEAVKSGDRKAIEEAAKILSGHPGLRGFKGIVTGAPRSKQGRPSNLVIARALVENGVGSSVEELVTRKTPVSSSRLLRRSGREGVSFDEHVASMAFVGSTSDRPVLIVDDMFTTGATLRATAKRIQDSGHSGSIMGATIGFDAATPAAAKDCPVKFATFRVSL